MFNSKYVKITKEDLKLLQESVESMKEENQTLANRLTETENIDKYNLIKEMEDLKKENLRLREKDEILYSYEQSDKLQKQEIQMLKNSIQDKEDVISSMRKLIATEREVTDLVLGKYKTSKNDVIDLKSKLQAEKVKDAYQEDIEIVSLRDLNIIL